ncbi:hypothetical protein B0H11DRAFT_1943539 [Mycena galericulata]|nr:hypothetical protein B0H11DRAFT_1943539 [Mycena galericulata]
MDPNLLSALQALVPFTQQLPLLTSQPTLVAPDAPPAVTAYISRRQQSIPPESRGHPNLTTAAPAPNLFQPFLGISSLGGRRPSVSALSRAEISQANTGRQVAMDAHLPHPPSLVPRQSRRPRGPAQPTPTLPAEDWDSQEVPNTVLHLYHALFGPHPPSDVEIMTFFTGLQLPCCNGFDFFQSSAHHPPPPLPNWVDPPPIIVLGRDREPSRWRLLKHRHNVEFEDHQRIEISFASPNDTGDGSDSTRRAIAMSVGKVSFRTCFRAARIPLSYLLGLSAKTYPAKDKDGNDTEPFPLMQVIEHWLLVEMLGGIGDQSMA